MFVPPLFQVEVMLVPTVQVRSFSKPKGLWPRTRGPDIDNRAVVGVRSLGVGDGDGTNGDGGVNTSGRGAASVVVVVTSGNDGGDTRVD